jgi:hypothetical protein
MHAPRSAFVRADREAIVMLENNDADPRGLRSGKPTPYPRS